jgi:undecaprenyl-diphosphatase
LNLALLLPAIVMGIVEGLTEFLPVSSTGHLLLMNRVIGFEGPPGYTFEISIQLGAILAVMWVFAGKLTGVAFRMFTRFEERYYASNIVLAFLPAAVIGATLHGTITQYLFDVRVVCVALIVGGIAIIIIERYRPPPTIRSVEEIGPLGAILIGCGQVLAMVPGTSRSGATIITALLLGVERRAAAEFSFVLAIPTMLAATGYTLYKNWDLLELTAFRQIAVGFVVAFIVALVTVKAVLAFIERIGFAPFGWYRIVLGTVGLVAIALGF